MVAAVSVITATSIGASSPACLPQDEASLQRRELTSSMFYPNTNAFGLQSFTTSPTDTMGAQCANSTFRGWSSELDCSSGVVPTMDTPDNEKAWCPWTHVDCYDPERIPMRMSVAQCKCSTCLNPKTNLPDPDLSCQPILYTMQVLRRDSSEPCIDGMFNYKQVALRVPVACACMRQRDTEA